MTGPQLIDGNGRARAVTTAPPQPSGAATKYHHDWHKNVPFHLSLKLRAVVAGMLVLIAAGSVWAATAPIDMAFLSAGRLVAQGKNRIVDHLEGGIVQDVLVREGDKVNAGDLLARMDVTTTATNLSNSLRQRDFKEIEFARYAGEQQDVSALVWPAALGDRIRNTPELTDAARTQVEEFEAKRNEMKSAKQILESRISVNTDLIASLEELRKERTLRIADTQREVAVSDDLFKRGLTTRDRNFSLKRQLASDQDQMRSTLIQIDEKRAALNEAKEQLNRTISQRGNEVADATIRLRSQIVDLDEKIRAYQAIVDRAAVHAPVAGIVVDISTNTQNQVVKPGEPLFEIFPSDLPMAIEARVEPRYIDTVAMDQHVAIQFGSRDRSRASVMLDGRVFYVSRDSVQDEQTGLFYYTVRASIDQKSLDAYGNIVPGNIATVYFQLEKQTFFQYLIAPYHDVQDRAFTG